MTRNTGYLQWLQVRKILRIPADFTDMTHCSVLNF